MSGLAKVSVDVERDELAALVFGAGLAIVGGALYPAPPPRTLAALAEMLGNRARAAPLSPSEIAWEPSPGIAAELLWGRRVLFLARAEMVRRRDLYRAYVRVTLEGRPVILWGVRNLTSTPLGDEQRLVVLGSESSTGDLFVRENGLDYLARFGGCRGTGRSVAAGIWVPAAITRLRGNQRHLGHRTARCHLRQSRAIRSR